MTKDIRTDNDFWLGTNGQRVSPMIPVVITNKQQAYRTAAWLETMAAILPDDGTEASYEEVREAILNT